MMDAMILCSRNQRPRAWLLACALVGATACGRIVGDSIGEGNGEQSPGGSGGAGAASTTGGPAGPPMMTPPEAQAFCEWYVNTAYPNADVNGAPVTAAVNDGYVQEGYEALYCYGPIWPPSACLLRPTVAHCVQNILNTWCEASIEALTECVSGILVGHAGDVCPTPGSCDAFVAAAGCDETVVHPMHDGGGEGGGNVLGCVLRVE
jgi:hypothetical protein